MLSHIIFYSVFPVDLHVLSLHWERQKADISNTEALPICWLFTPPLCMTHTLLHTPQACFNTSYNDSSDTHWATSFHSTAQLCSSRPLNLTHTTQRQDIFCVCVCARSLIAMQLRSEHVLGNFKSQAPLNLLVSTLENQ